MILGRIVVQPTSNLRPRQPESSPARARINGCNETNNGETKMKKALKNTKITGLYHFVDGVRIAGAPSGLKGYVSGLEGDVTGLKGYVSGLEGDVTGLKGDVTGLKGDVDECGLSDEERESGVDVSTLISE